MFEGKAKLEYNNSWLVANCDQGILEYYRWWFWRENHIWLMRPRWGAHISVVRGKEERTPVQFLFEFKRSNPVITFKYSNCLEKRDDGYVWMPVWSKELEDVREECGLPRRPIMPFHMSVGRSDLL